MGCDEASEVEGEWTVRYLRAKREHTPAVGGVRKGGRAR